MSSWRDDLPPIPAERIRAEAIREGTLRREMRQRRQRTALVGGVGAAAVALIVVSGVLTGPSKVDNGDAATADTSRDTSAAAEGTTPVTPDGAADTEAPAATEAPADTIAQDTSDTSATVVDYTTVVSPNAVEPSPFVSVDPAEIFEEVASGPACGPSTLDVAFQPQDRAPTNPIVHWETNGVTGETSMVIDGDVARATVGPFAPATLDAGVSFEVLVYVTDTDASGATQIFRSPPVVLRDCSP